MAEVITETILPGTYIEVRAEGLLTIGAIATGNVGLLGTAEKGDAMISRLSSFDQGRAVFGHSGSWDPSAPDDNLSLVRGMKLLFDNGASTVYARRVFDENTAVSASMVLQGESGSSLTLTAKTAGAWGNRLQIRIEEGERQDLVVNELVVPSGNTYTLSAAAVATPAQPDESIGTVIVRDQGLTHRHQLKVAPGTGGVQVNPGDRTLSFPVTPSPAAEVRVSYMVPKDNLRVVTLRYDNVQEVYIVPSLSYLMQLVENPRDPSGLADASNLTADGLPQTTTGFMPFSGGANGSVSSTHFQNALEEMVEQNIQLLVVLRPYSEMRAAILGHVEKTENQGRERMAVLGADSDQVNKILENANEMADKRAVLVAPGLKQQDPELGRMITLPPYYAAAAVAGKLSALSPHISPTNKTLAGIERLAEGYTQGDLKALVQNRVLVLQQKRGIRVVKGITTHDEAFKQITLRRIVDYVKEGTRVGANQYIGKLNNRRVRENLRTTLDSFLSDLVIREFLVGYNLTVFADRAMEIRGEVLVTMDLMPTFSIDVIRVIMNLQ